MIPQIRRTGQHAVLYATIRQQLIGGWAADQLGAQSWHIDSDQKVFTYATPQGPTTARAQLLASIAVEPAVLVWGHASMHEQTTGPHQAAKRMGAYGDRHALGDFSAPEVPYPFSAGTQSVDIDRLSHDVGAAAIEVFGASYSYYSAPTDETGSRVVVLLDEWSDQPPVLTLEDVFTRLPQLLPECDDAQWSLEGLVRLMPGWTLERHPHEPASHRVWRVTDDQGSSFLTHVEYVEGQMTTVQMRRGDAQ